MVRIIDDTTLPNDKFGYRIYGVMAHLPEPQASEIRKFHKLVGADDLATRPHCSLDNFWGPDDLDAVKAAIGQVAARDRGRSQRYARRRLGMCVHVEAGNCSHRASRRVGRRVTPANETNILGGL